MRTFFSSLLLLTAAAHAAPPQASSIGRINDVPTIIVNKQPFLITGAQCDGRTVWKRDKVVLAFLDGYQKMNATTVGINVMWSIIEPKKDQYDFESIDWFIKEAEARGLKIVLQLFSTNVCSMIEVPGVIRWTPEYILNDPKSYSRMNFGTLDKPSDPASWAMSPNDPNTLERERLYHVKLAEHLRDTDTKRTVIMLQINNEVGYPGYDHNDAGRAVRDKSKYSEAKFKAGKYKDGFDFMCHSLADEAEAMATAVSKVYDIPMYLNSPMDVPVSIQLFLDCCPSIAAVAADAMTSPAEPNYLSRIQVGRNIPFMGENPTEGGGTQENLDILPWYTIIGRPGLGNLLWEASWDTVVDKPASVARYAAALYPIKNAMVPIANARGGENLAGWYSLRNSFFVREGTKTRNSPGQTFTLTVDSETKIDVTQSVAGAVIRTAPGKYMLATSGGDFLVRGVKNIKAVSGTYAGETWTTDQPVPVTNTADGCLIHAPQSTVIRFITRP